MFKSEIQNLKTTNPQEFWKIIKTESNYKLRESSLTIFTEFLDHFREINIDPVFTVIDSPLYQVSVNSQYEAINKPFSIENLQIQIQNLFLTAQSTQIKSVISVPIKDFIHHYPRALFNDIPKVGAYFYDIPGSGRTFTTYPGRDAV